MAAKTIYNNYFLFWIFCFIILAVTPSIPTCAPEIENRTALPLGNDCGEFSNLGYCSDNKSTCIPPETGNIWRCRCSTGYVYEGGECVAAPSKLFDVEKITLEVENGTEPGKVGRTSLRQSLAPLNPQLLSYTIRPQTQQYLFGLQTQGHNIIISSLRDISAKNTHELVLYATAEVGNSLGSVVLSDVIEIEVQVTRVTSNLIQTFTTHITDDTIGNQVVFRIPLENFQESATLQVTGTDIFKLDSASGLVYTNKDVREELLNDEIGMEINIEVKNAGKLETAAYLKVLIVRSEYKIELKEGRDPDKNIGIFAVISPDLNISVSGVSSEYFYTDGVNLFRGNYNFDFDSDPTKREYKFNIIISAPSYATSSFNGEISSDIVVRITDENDEPPKFVSQKYNMILLQSALSDVIIGFIKADDIDTVGVVTYEIENKYQSYFRINELGAIFSKVPVTSLSNITGYNAETGGIEFSTKATDGVSFSTTKVHIQIQNPPERNLELRFHGEIEEGAPIGTNITSIFIKDYTHYEFARTVEGALYFHLNLTTGEVSNNKVFDREQENKVEFVVTAIKEDAFTCSLTILGELIVTVLDINDNPPEFESNAGYEGSVLEGEPVGTEILKSFKVTDKDTHELTTISYSISEGHSSLFAIDSVTGKLTTLVILDRENVAEYNVTVNASDGVNNGTTFVVITVLDINDNKPEFAQGHFEFFVPEDAEIGHSLGEIAATDRDDGRNADVTFDLVGGQGYFNIDKNRIIRVQHSLDRETTEFFSLTVVATDGGKIPKNSTAATIVVVSDINDNIPRFNATTTEANVHEDTSCSSSIHKVIAVDADSGPNQEIEYSLLSQNDKFVIDPQTGVIACKSSFQIDYETTQRHEILVMAKDGGTEQKNSIVTIIIKIIDVNDNDPEFTDDFADGVHDVSLRSDNFRGSTHRPLLVIPVDDRDSGDNGVVTLEIFEGNFSHFLHVDSTSRLLSSKGSAIPAPDSYQIILVAKDGGSPTRQSNVTINFLITASIDINNKIEFTRENVELLNVMEGPTSLDFTDDSIPSFVNNKDGKQMKYSIITPQTVFQINEDSGQVSVLKELDREEKAEYFFVVKAENKLNLEDSDLALVKIKVQDINDNTPEFSQQRYIYVVSEDAVIGFTPSSKIQATDADESVYTKLRYRLVATTDTDSACWFRIDEVEGSLSVQAELDYEATSLCTFNVEVTDSDISPNKATAIVDVNIQDVNDNTPTFNQPVDYIYLLEVKEDAKLNHKITSTAKVTDADSRENGDIVFEIKPNSDCLFSVEEAFDSDQSVPVLKVVTALDYETKNSSTCIIIAKDKSTTLVRSSSATFSIDILDVNDNAPVVIDDPYTVDIPRDINISSDVLSKINATDADQGLNAKLKYKLDDIVASTYGDYFRVNTDTGAITIKNSLAPLQKDFVRLVINVEDSGSPALSATANVEIIITDANIRPHFNSYREGIALEEERTITGDIFKAVAYDRNGSHIDICQCTYRIEGHADLFVINQTTGVLRLLPNMKLNREKSPVITVPIIARDSGDRQKDTDRLLLTITVSDINDQAPVFVTDFSFDLLQKAPVETVIGSVTAVDRDEGANAVIEYSVVKVTMPDQPSIIMSTNPVKINTATGQLVLNGSIDRNATEDFVVVVKVKAVDSLDDQKFSYTDVRLNVKFDNPNKHEPKCKNDRGNLNVTTSPNTVIIKVNGTDSDAGRNGEIKYEITGGNYRNVFHIVETKGDIVLDYAVDKEFSSSKYPSNFSLIVKVIDNGEISLTGTCTIFIQVYGTPEVCVANGEFQTATEEKNVYFTSLIGIAVLLVLSIISTLILTYLYCTTTRRVNEIESTAATSPYKPTFMGFDEKKAMLDRGGFNPEHYLGDTNTVDNLSDIMGYEEAISPELAPSENTFQSPVAANNTPFEPKPDYDDGDNTSEEIDIERVRAYASRDEAKLDFKTSKKRSESSRKQRHREVYGEDSSEQNSPRRNFHQNASRSAFLRGRDDHLVLTGSDWDMRRNARQSNI